MSKATPAKANLFKVRLKKAHTHAGEPKAPGESIMVTAPERAFLAQAGVIAPLVAEVNAPASQPHED